MLAKYNQAHFVLLGFSANHSFSKTNTKLKYQGVDEDDCMWKKDILGTQRHGPATLSSCRILPCFDGYSAASVFTSRFLQEVFSDMPNKNETWTGLKFSRSQVQMFGGHLRPQMTQLKGYLETVE